MHAVHGVALGVRDGEEAGFGDAGLRTFWRSAMKPFQALPLVEDGAAQAFGFGPEDLALCCASHGGTPAHVSRARHLLDRLSLTEQALACGRHAPFDQESAERILRAGGEFTPLHHNCSGKHAGMLALARHRGWPTEGYERPTHLVQVRIREGLARWIGCDPRGIAWAVDSCGVPTPSLSLREMALAYLRLGLAARDGEGPAAAVVGAMTSHPELTSSPGRFPLVVMQATHGRLLAKEGAEGVLCLVAPAEGWSLALKVLDGGRRACGPAAVEMLVSLGLLGEGEEARLGAERRVLVEDTRGRTVGEITGHVEPRFSPAPAGA